MTHNRHIDHNDHGPFIIENTQNEPIVITSSKKDYQLGMMIYHANGLFDDREITISSFVQFVKEKMSDSSIEQKYVMAITSDLEAFEDFKKQRFEPYQYHTDGKYLGIKEILINRNFEGICSFVALVTDKEMKTLSAIENKVGTGLAKLMLLGYFIENIANVVLK